MRKNLNLISALLGIATAGVVATGCGKSMDDIYPDMGGTAAASRNFANLINNYREAKTTPTPWAGWWWPYKSNGIANGTYGSGQSPAGKYDAVRGWKNQAQAWEAANHGSKVPKIQDWWGHCNGWTAASALFPEPKEDIRYGGLTFTVSDQKALLSETALEVNADFFGDRVEPWDFSDAKLYDTVPDQFFLVLANYAGKNKHAVLIDRYTTEQIWNQPLVGYRFQYPKKEDYLGADPHAPDVYRINLTATIWWASDNVQPGIVSPPFNFEESNVYDSRELRAEIWLDGPVVFDDAGHIVSSGDVIATRDPANPNHVVGGKWNMAATSQAWPDYMWVPYSVFERDPDMTEDDPYRNPYVDPNWIMNYFLTGTPDPHASPLPVETAPTPQPSPSPSAHPSPAPTHHVI